jgi:endonuclease III
VKNASSHARKLAALLRKLKSQNPAPPPPAPDPVTQLVLAFLQWDATRKLADAAYQRLTAAMVDSNDLRVSHPDEVLKVLGERYPKASERAGRLLDVLQEIFVREHAVTLAPLAQMGKKEARAYLDSLPGMTPYVSALVMVACFAGHAIPVDDGLARLLIEHGMADADATREQMASFLEHHVKAGEALEAHHLLRAWADAGGAAAGAKAPKAPAPKTPPHKR